MEQLEKINQTLKNINGIGNVIINYNGYDKPIDAIPITLGDEKTYLLTNIRAAAGRSRLILQDLNGNTIKELMNFGFENGVVTVDNDNIYVFTSNSNDPMFYTFDKKSLELKYEKALGESRIQSVCCNENEIFTFDMDNAEVQCRDKKGNVISAIDITKRGNHFSVVSHTNVYSAADGFHFARLGDFGIGDNFRKECEKKFGKDFMDLNRFMEKIAYDESSQTLYVASRNIVCVANQSEIKGIMYFPNKSIMGISVNSEINSLVISSSNWPEADECCPFDKGGSLEILPISMVSDRIKSSEEFLIARNQNKRVIDLCHKIVDKSNGDIDKMIHLLQEIKIKSVNSSLSIEDNNSYDIDYPKKYSK